MSDIVFWNFVLTQGEYILQLLVAVLCGAVIGYERQNRMKEPGIRTHIIVSMAASMMMIISKCGFFDVIQVQGVSLDPSRIAASIVTAIGFLGAGAIFFQNKTVVGLTTSAGMWATVGVGMAIGAKMYVLGIATTLLILLIQIVLHKNLKFMQSAFAEYDVVFILENDSEMTAKLKSFLDERELEIVKFKASHNDTGGIKVSACVRFPKEKTPFEILDLLNEVDFIKSIEI